MTRRPSLSKVVFATFLIIFAVFVVWFFQSVFLTQPILKQIEKTKNCLEKLFLTLDLANGYKNLPNSSAICTADLFNSLPILFLGIPALETKYFLRPVEPFANCDVLTLGIGTEIIAEMDLKRMMPQCTFVGVDPDAKANADYEGQLHGKLIEGAVGAKDGEYTASILNSTSGGYFPKTIKHISFRKILKVAKAREVVDVVLMDVEGAEYEIFNIIAENKNLPVFCQFNVEIHGEKPNILSQLSNLIKNSGFLPLKIDGTSFGFHRTFWVNVDNPLCLGKYFGIN